MGSSNSRLKDWRSTLDNSVPQVLLQCFGPPAATPLPLTNMPSTSVLSQLSGLAEDGPSTPRAMLGRQSPACYIVGTSERCAWLKTGLGPGCLDQVLAQVLCKRVNLGN